jgi:hypothetical protein
MSYIEYTITSSGGTLNTNLDKSYVITSPSPVTLAAGFSIVPLLPIPYAPITIRWNTSVSLGGFPLTIGGISVNQDQVNQTGTFELMYDGTSYYLQYFPDFTQKPQETYGVTTVTVPAGGGTLTIAPGTNTKTYVLQGTTTLTSNYTVTGSTSGVTDGSAVRVVVAGGITTGSNTVTIFGQSISKYDCLTGGVEVYAEFNSTTSSYVSTYVNKDTPLGKLSTTGLVSGDNGKLVTYDFASNAFVASFLSQSNFPTSLKTVNVTTTTISSAQILNCFTSPITLVPASGSASVVEMPLAFIVKYIPGGTPYATNVDAVFEFSALSPVTQKLASKTNLFTFATAGYDMILVDNYNLSGTPDIMLGPNYPITLRTATGNPTAGNGTLIVYTVSVTLNL